MLLDYKIKFYKRKLNQMIQKEKSYDEILKVSQKLDVLINKKMFEKTVYRNQSKT